MSHGPATQWKDTVSTAKKTKLGIQMCIAYTIFYAGFIIINVTNPRLMRMDVGPLNLAIAYGFALIVIAIILALIYNHMCTKMEKQFDK
jgi:uncharacterized membrane protein (DUF485 family)